MVNLGTPDAPTPSAIKTYLWQFLRDRRVVDLPAWFWSPLLRTLILPRRVPRVAKLYQSIWTEQGSPLLAESLAQQQALSAALPDYDIALGMTYGNPSIESALAQLKSVDKLIILPLFPQYSSATTASVWDAVNRYYATQRAIPTTVFIHDYAAHPDYIAALTDSIKMSFEQHGEPDLLLFSYHGIPQRYVDTGDPYPIRCDKTKQYVEEQFPRTECQMSFQSRFGKEVWLKPYTDKILAKLPERGIKHVQVICPGFAADCLETLEEIAVQGKEIFLKAGGEQLHYIPALNHHQQHITCLANIIKSNSE